MAAAAAGWLDMRYELLGRPAPVKQQRIGIRQRRAGTEEDGEKEEGHKPALHRKIIPSRSLGGQWSGVGRPTEVVEYLVDQTSGGRRSGVGPARLERATSCAGAQAGALATVHRW
jgi:hypothetical protein